MCINITKGRLIHVFGCAAKRDTYKRPEMGKISARFADIIVLTSEDPRDEPIEKINLEIASGIKDSKFEVIEYQRIMNHESRIMVLQNSPKANSAHDSYFIIHNSAPNFCEVHADCCKPW